MRARGIYAIQFRIYWSLKIWIRRKPRSYWKKVTTKYIRSRWAHRRSSCWRTAGLVLLMVFLAFSFTTRSLSRSWTKLLSVMDRSIQLNFLARAICCWLYRAPSRARRQWRLRWRYGTSWMDTKTSSASQWSQSRSQKPAGTLIWLSTQMNSWASQTEAITTGVSLPTSKCNTKKENCQRSSMKALGTTQTSSPVSPS